jgi:hypothetical protein
MKTLDKVFVLLFARCRRKLGESNLDYVWRRASTQFDSYISWPLTAAVFLLWILTYSIVKFGSHASHKPTLQIIGVAVWLAAYMSLSMRFKKYLRDPPALAVEESSNERYFLLRFRVASISVYVLTCLVALFLGWTRFHFMQGY